jgi:predicted RecB family nuclease
MQAVNGRLIFSATDLSHFLACPHLTLLNRRTALGGPRPVEFPDPGIEVLRQRGHEHEQRFLAGLRESGSRRIVDLSGGAEGPRGVDHLERQAAATLAAMRDGTEVIYQGTLFDGAWLGYPDFLLRVERASGLGDWSYEVADTKLAREAKGGALLQVLLYSDLLAAVQGVSPESVHLALGGPEAPRSAFRVNHYAAYYRSVRRRFLDWVAAAPEELPRAVDPVPHCDICDWEYACSRERREVDHLCFVAGISRQQRLALAEHGITTLEGLGKLDPAALPSLDGIKPVALKRVQGQALIQLQGRRQNKLLQELLQPITADKGLAALPPPSEGDLFFDLEGDPYAFETGIEYLFGVADSGGSYTARWCLGQVQEREAFEWFMDMVMERLRQHPDVHIYHYAPYEPTALKRLAGRHDTRIDELDRLLRGRVFVDLYRVVRQGLRASVESYSIKKLEDFYRYQRKQDLREANAALANFEAWLQLGGAGDEGSRLLSAIEGYNKDDCLSTLKLRDWLEGLRTQLARESGAPVPRPGPPAAEEQEELTERLKEVRALMARLMERIPELSEQRSPEQHGQWLVAQMLEYHRRENKSMWWRYFAWLDMSDEELIEDGSALGGMEYVTEAGTVRRSVIHRYRFPAQDHQLKPGAKTHDPATGKPAGEIHALDEAAGTIDLVRGKRSTVPHPRALIPYEYVDDTPMRESLLRLGYAVERQGMSGQAPYQSALELVLANRPRVGQPAGDNLARSGESPLDSAIRLVQALDHSILPIQGPPGSGKTFTGAQMILALLKAGKKVGVTATSHKVISNLLMEVCEKARESRQPLQGIQKADQDDWCKEPEIIRAGDNAEVLDALRSGAQRLAAGTAWLWSREDMMGSLDVLFIDEAGQFSLANTLAVAPAAKSLVLLGDPRQLQQPQQGLHPPGTEVSALDHLLAGRETMPPDRGLFLDQTWRLHPEICAFTSEIYYEGRLRSRAGLEQQGVNGDAAITGSGLRRLAVEHSGNESESPEEAGAISALIEGLLEAGLTWTDREGQEKKLGLNDILVVAPYNAQVAAIAERLPPGARVGTVDKFQGQEAPIVIYSMASSSAEDASRGMEFLYSPNRLNVATSRARCLVILVANDQVFMPACRAPEQMRLANGLCRYLELARPA